MGTSLMSQDKAEARKKGFWAAGAASGSVLLFVAGSPVLGVAAAGGAAFLTFRWFMYRAKRGMRF